SALTLPRAAGEPLDAFAGRIVEDSRSRQKAATDFGTAFHAGAQRVAGNPIELDPADPLAEWLQHYRDWFQANCQRLIWTERVLVNHPRGYAGTADLLIVHRVHGLSLVDLKTQAIKEKSLPRIYPSWLYQLAAYRAALGQEVACLNVVVNSARPEPVGEQVWSSAHIREAWAVFNAARLIWRYEKDYDPTQTDMPPAEPALAA
ncbi:MAG TPA: PD-(D/E)XK nuclease family protein, partial [Geobacteraceae bacterium]